MAFSTTIVLITLLLLIPVIAVIIVIIVLLIRALRKYLRTAPGENPAAAPKMQGSSSADTASPGSGQAGSMAAMDGASAYSRAKRPLCEILKELRAQNNMTQEYVAESLGISRQAVSKWENGESSPSMANLVSLAKLYGIALEDILKDMAY